MDDIKIKKYDEHKYLTIIRDIVMFNADANNYNIDKELYDAKKEKNIIRNREKFVVLLKKKIPNIDVEVLLTPIDRSSIGSINVEDIKEKIIEQIKEK